MGSKSLVILWCKARSRVSRSWRCKSWQCCIYGSLAEAVLWCVVEGDVLGHKNKSPHCFSEGQWCGVPPGCLGRFGYVEDGLLVLKAAAFIRHWRGSVKRCFQHSGVFTWCSPRKAFCIASTDVCCTQGSTTWHSFHHIPCALFYLFLTIFLKNKPLLLFALCSSVTSELLQALLPSVLARL